MRRLAKPRLTLLDADPGFAFMIGIGLVTAALPAGMLTRGSGAMADARAI
jgi:hypothetical protein